MDADEDLLASAGFRIEGPGGLGDEGLTGRYWWTLYRDGWSGVECGKDFATRNEALVDALRAMKEELTLGSDSDQPAADDS